MTGVGLGVSRERLDDALAGPVAAVVFDDAGTDEIAALLDGLVDTDFARENMDRLLADTRVPEDWRVGEGLAECFLVECRNCIFPWPGGRDERKRGSSLPGADLVGFHHDGLVDRFAFGEVKTSGAASYPPGNAYGRHGLKKQLEDLRDSVQVRDGLVLYLGHRAANASWRDRYRSAAALYLQDSGDVRIFGLLVRDVPPHEDDLRARVDRLGRGCPGRTVIELIAIYLPAGSIPTLAARVVAARGSGGMP